jgi:hypothetical protein
MQVNIEAKSSVSEPNESTKHASFSIRNRVSANSGGNTKLVFKIKLKQIEIKLFFYCQIKIQK